MKKLGHRSSDHRFDFGDTVYVKPLHVPGTINSIQDAQGSWRYCISGYPDQWWNEDQIERACPQCLSSWAGLTPCSCGFSYDD